MSKKYTTLIITTFLIIFNIVVFKFPKEIIDSSMKGLNIWTKSLIPSLLPFIFINNLARETGVFHFLGNLICQPIAKILKISNISAVSYLSAIFSGYPIGSKLAYDNFESKYISKEEATCVALFSNIPSPLFTLGTVGVTLFNNKGFGIYLLCIQIATSFVLGLLFTYKRKSYFSHQSLPYNYVSFTQTLSHCISNTITTITTIGFYVIILSILTKIFTILGLLQLLSNLLCLLLSPIGLNKTLANSIVIGFFEMTSGLVYISENETITNLSASITSFMLAFGGLSINSQCYSFLGNIGISFIKFLIIKLLQGLIALLLTTFTYSYIFL